MNASGTTQALLRLVPLMALAGAALGCAAAASGRSTAPSRTCGPGDEVFLGTCAPRPAPAVPCPRGHARDLDQRGACLAPAEVRGLARNQGIFVADDDLVFCETATDELAASRTTGAVACLAPASPSACPLGAVPDGARCAALEQDGILDLPRFARAAADALCLAALDGPVDLPKAAAEARVALTLTLRVPGNDPSLATAEVSAQAASTEGPRARPREVALGGTVERVIDAMRRAGLGARASASIVRVEARCARGAGRPRSGPPSPSPSSAVGALGLATTPRLDRRIEPATNDGRVGTLSRAFSLSEGSRGQ